MSARRVLPTAEATDLLKLVRDLATKELLPAAAVAEKNERFDRDAFRMLGRAGILGLPYPDHAGKRVVVVEDVTTTGGSALKAGEAVKDAGGEVALVYTLVDREEGADATFAAVQRHAAGADVLHLACHADFRSDNPMFSALHLEGAPLAAESAETLGLRPGIVVLSACETGLGDLTGGEGVQGLVRAFHLAGCPDVVASLWNVNDDATAALMAEFYRHLWQENLPPIEALRQAQLTIYRHPERVRELAGDRAPPDQSQTTTVNTGKAAPAVPSKTAAGKSPPKWWAAFVLSGAGR